MKIYTIDERPQSAPPRAVAPSAVLLSAVPLSAVTSMPSVSAHVLSVGRAAVAPPMLDAVVRPVGAAGQAEARTADAQVAQWPGIDGTNGFVSQRIDNVKIDTKANKLHATTLKRDGARGVPPLGRPV